MQIAIDGAKAGLTQAAISIDSVLLHRPEIQMVDSAEGKNDELLYQGKPEAWHEDIGK